MTETPLLDRLKAEAIQRGLLGFTAQIDAAQVFALVRDMPYRRASDRRPETIIAEWQGTCSGKHYLLQALFAELGLSSEVIACPTVTPVDPAEVPEPLRPLYEAANRRFVDVHNYLLVTIPGGSQMKVDATWPLSKRKAGMIVNETFILGQDQQLASTPIENWAIPAGRDPQGFKDELLKSHFSTAELEFREIVIQALGAETRE
jgi:hypothetical protein